VGKLAESYTWIAATSTKDDRHVYAYDSLGRPSSSTATLDWDYSQLNTYDSFGHLATVTHRRSAVGGANVGSNPTGTGALGLPEIQYILGYNSHGAASIVVRGGATLWALNAQDAAGRTTLGTLGNGLVTATCYNPYTAFLEQIQTGPGSAACNTNASIQSDRYDYDPVGNLLHRYWLPASAAAQMSETFTYDELDRLKSSQVGGLDLKSFGYDALGNITSKTNVGTYAYPAANTAHPHLLSGITGTVVGLTNPSFAYDANGNTQSGLNRLYAWSAANLPLSVDQLSDGTPASATLRHEFLYGPERERTREIVRAMSGTAIGAVQRMIYSADAIEKEIDAVAGTTKIRTYLPLGLGFTEEDFTGTSIVPTSIGTPKERYYHKDNLGSPVIVTDASQTVLERMAYDAWGRRRQSNGLEVDWQSLSAQSASNTLDHKGYTGQEQLDDLSLVHLNGRVYDPMTARFTSPDPTIPDPYDLQSLNRASYVRNSPMDKVDPTGFSDAPQPTQPPKPTYNLHDGSIASVDARTVGPADLGGGGTTSNSSSKPAATVSAPGSMPLVNKSVSPSDPKGGGGTSSGGGGFLSTLKNWWDQANRSFGFFDSWVPDHSSFLAGASQLAGGPCMSDNCTAHDVFVQQTADVFHGAGQAVAETANRYYPELAKIAATGAIGPEAEGAATGITILAKATRNSANQLAVNLTQSQAIENLAANGFVKTMSKDGTVTIMSGGDRVYRFYPQSTGGGVAGAQSGVPSASVSVLDKIVAKLRFQGQ
jgi:RHS repeat-associated protein